MAIAEDLEEARSALDLGDYETANQLVEKALAESPNSVKALVLKADLLLKQKKAGEAIEVAEKALKLAVDLGRRELMSEAYYRLSIAYYRRKEYTESLRYVKKAVQYAPGNNEYGMFEGMVERICKKKGIESPEEPEDTDKPVVPGAPIVTPAAAAAPVAAAKSFRTDWVESSSNVEVSVFVKKINKDTVKAEFTPTSVSFSFEDAAGEKYNYKVDPLFGKIDPEASKYRVFGTKLEITMVKAEQIKWSSVEKPASGVGNTRQIPKDEEKTVTPQGKTIDWSKFEVEDEEEPENPGEDGAIDFFQKLYADADDDTKRAMMKSYIESNGTALSTDWSEVKKGKVKESPAPSS